MIGVTSALGLLALYGIIMTGFSGWQATVEQFRTLWFLMIPLAAGFGFQVALFTKLRNARGMTGTVAASGGSASIGMLACCAHHATDVLPFLGMSATSIFLTRYQIPILLTSLGINGIGIGLMVRSLKRMGLSV